MKILIVEDEKHIADGLRFNLEAEGFEVAVAESGEEGLKEIKDDLDAIILDVMLPGMSGFDFAKQLRRSEDHTPILMLTALGRPEDVVHGFEAGADDYLAKPFDLNIFLARLKGLLRRSNWQQRGETPASDMLEVNGRVIDFADLELRSGQERVHLTLMEANLLKYLVDNAGRAVSRKEILENVWDLKDDTDTRAIDNFIVRLRRYLEDEPNNPQVLKTVRGVGYRFVRE